MKLSELDFALKKELIAQYPLSKKGEANLMIVERETKRIFHKKFKELESFLNLGDILVLNDIKVDRRKITAFKSTGAKVELTFLSSNTAIIKGRVKIGEKLMFSNFTAVAKKRLSEAPAIFQLFISPPLKLSQLEKIAKVPLPPYIKSDVSEEDYQTEYAQRGGGLAAPTAGLHFSREHLSRLEKLGIKITFLTLEVSLGTYLPIRTENVEEHQMHSENFYIPRETAGIINDGKREQKRIIAAGTTSLRALESAVYKTPEGNWAVKPGRGKTDLFILPGYQFKIVSGLITNFHLPKSTLLALVFAFGGKELISKAYKEAIRLKYRFFSFGDAMFII